MQMPSAHHTFHDERQTNAHDITHDASGMPIVPGSGPLIIRPDGQRMEVSACLHLGLDSQLETECHTAPDSAPQALACEALRDNTAAQVCHSRFCQV